MRIDGIFTPEHLTRPNGKAPEGKAKSSGTQGADAGGLLERASVQPSLIQAALAADDVNVKAVEEARKALLSGELDTPEAARRAAETLLDHGV